VAKRRLGAPLDSEPTSGEGVQNLLCAHLVGVLAVAGRALTRIAAGDANGLRHPLSASVEWAASIFSVLLVAMSCAPDSGSRVPIDTCRSPLPAQVVGALT
jgi:hypothetical protein